MRLLVPRRQRRRQKPQKQYTKTFAISDGAKGAVTFDGTSLEQSEGVKAKAIDTNGAGDKFSGAFLYAITAGKNYGWAASLPNDCEVRVVARFGPRLDPDDFSAIKQRFGI